MESSKAKRLQSTAQGIAIANAGIIAAASASIAVSSVASETLEAATVPR